MGEILDVSFGLYRVLFVPLLMVSIFTKGVPLIASVYLQSSGGALAHLTLSVVISVLNLVLAAVAAAASTFVISENYMGRRITAVEALRRSVPFIGRLVALALLTGFVVGIGLLLIFIPGFILLAGLVLATPALVIEGIPNATDAMGRAWSLSRQHRLKIFACVLVAAILIYLPGLSLGAYAAVSAMGSDSGATGVDSISVLWLAIITALQVLIYPLLNCVLTVAYYDLRVRKEAFDLEVLAAGLSRA
jgi:hypothetical protein